MPQTKTLTVFSFDELSEKAKEKVLNHLREDGVELDFVVEDWQEEKLPALGFDNASVAYSGFCSQGDGASFTAKVNILTWLKVNKLLGQNKELVKFLKGDICSIDINVVRTTHQYCHEYTISVESDGHLYNDVPDKVTEQVDALHNVILENVREVSRKIYKELEKEYEYQTSDEYIIEEIKNNDWTFRENGTMENI